MTLMFRFAVKQPINHTHRYHSTDLTCVVQIQIYRSYLCTLTYSGARLYMQWLILNETDVPTASAKSHLCQQVLCEVCINSAVLHIREIVNVCLLLLGWPKFLYYGGASWN